MPAPLRVHLSEADDETLRQLSLTDGLPAIVKQRAMAIRLNAGGWNVPAIARHLHLHEHTIRTALKRWHGEGEAGLWDAPRSGRPCQWQPEDWAAIETWLQAPRSYTSRQLCEQLQQERQVVLSPRQLSRILKKKGIVGNACATAPARPKTLSTPPTNTPTGNC
jgi:transposase